MNSFLCWLHETGIVLAEATWILPSSACLPPEKIQTEIFQNKWVFEQN